MSNGPKTTQGSVAPEGGEFSALGRASVRDSTPSRLSQGNQRHALRQSRNESTTKSVDLINDEAHNYYRSKYAPRTGSVLEKLTLPENRVGGSSEPRVAVANAQGSPHVVLDHIEVPPARTTGPSPLALRQDR